MSKSSYPEADNKPLEDVRDAPLGQVDDDSFATQGKGHPVPVVGDTEPVEDPIKPGAGDTEQELRRDEQETMDKSNIMKDRTRGAKPRRGYNEVTEDDITTT